MCQIGNCTNDAHHFIYLEGETVAVCAEHLHLGPPIEGVPANRYSY